MVIRPIDDQIIVIGIITEGESKDMKKKASTKLHSPDLLAVMTKVEICT
jgi:hypothetical protein